MTLRLHEGKYELDSLAAVLKHFNRYYETTRDRACFRPDWIDAMRLILDTITDQQISMHDHIPSLPRGRWGPVGGGADTARTAAPTTRAPSQARRTTGRTRTTASTATPRWRRTP